MSEKIRPLYEVAEFTEIFTSRRDGLAALAQEGEEQHRRARPFCLILRA
jgi:hypothetical protein